MIHFKFIGSFLLFLATHFARNASDCAECVLNAFQISMEMCVCVCAYIQDDVNKCSFDKVRALAHAHGFFICLCRAMDDK